MSYTEGVKVVVTVDRETNKVGVVTNVRRSKNKPIKYDVRTEDGSAYIMISEDSPSGKKPSNYAYIDPILTHVWNDNVEAGNVKDTNMHASKEKGHTRANFHKDIPERLDGESHGLLFVGTIERCNDFSFPVSGPRSFQ